MAAGIRGQHTPSRGNQRVDHARAYPIDPVIRGEAVGEDDRRAAAGIEVGDLMAVE
jgi:hypothetical protein